MVSFPYYLVVSFPSQGHINPAIQFAKRLLRTGAHVTFATTISAHRKMSKPQLPDGLSYVTFSDGYDDGFTPGDDRDRFMATMKRLGPLNLEDAIKSKLEQGWAFTHVFYTSIVPWVADVARSLHLPSTLLWAQPATVLDIYYFYYFGGGHGDSIKELASDHSNQSSSSIHLPGLPPLTGSDIPSFFAPQNHHAYALPLMKWHIEVLGKERNSKVLVNTFDALEEESLRAIGELNMIGIGPMLPSAFLDDGHDPRDTSFGADMFEGSQDYIEWLNTKSKSSVIYVAFGTISGLSKHQRDQMMRGLLSSGYPFLWVVTITEDNDGKPDTYLVDQGGIGRQGMIVSWCSQVEVLSHPSVGCFLTHCGWNSTLESMACGVPMVALPQWSDQFTNSKLVEDVWKIGVRAVRDEEGIVRGDEIRRCLELVIEGGEEGQRIRRNVKKWKNLAMEATRNGGSSDKNLTAFLNEIQGSTSH